MPRRQWIVPLPLVTRQWLAEVAGRERTTPVELVQEAVDVFFALRYYLDGAWNGLVRDASRNGLSTGELLARIVDEVFDRDRASRVRREA